MHCHSTIFVKIKVAYFGKPLKVFEVTQLIMGVKVLTQLKSYDTKFKYNISETEKIL